jgi:hypothetical protein
MSELGRLDSGLPSWNLRSILSNFIWDSFGEGLSVELIFPFRSSFCRRFQIVLLGLQFVRVDHRQTVQGDQVCFTRYRKQESSYVSHADLWNRSHLYVRISQRQINVSNITPSTFLMMTYVTTSLTDYDVSPFRQQMECMMLITATIYRWNFNGQFDSKKVKLFLRLSN